MLRLLLNALLKDISHTRHQHILAGDILGLERVVCINFALILRDNRIS